jgi:glutamate racemase
VDSHKYKNELHKYNSKIEVLEQACPLWVPMVEKKLKNYDEKTIITQYLKKVIEFNPQKIILGCTHYPYLLEQLTKYIEPEVFINPAKIFANYIKQDLLRNNMNTSNKIGNIQYFASSNIEEFKENSKLFFEIENTPELITI